MSLYWTSERIIDAIQTWAHEHGRPPGMRDWMTVAVWHPTAQTVRERFGSFSEGIRAAGYTPRQPGRPRQWTKDSIADAMLEERLRLGRWPLLSEWNLGGPNHPSANTVLRYFGSWIAAKRYAGWQPHCVVCTRAFRTSRPERRYCTLRCKRHAEWLRVRAATKRGPAARATPSLGDAMDGDGRATSLPRTGEAKQPAERRAA